MLPASVTLAADRAYDSDALRRMLIARGTTPVIPNGPRRKNLHPFDRTAYKRRFCCIKACRLPYFEYLVSRHPALLPPHRCKADPIDDVKVAPVHHEPVPHG